MVQDLLFVPFVQSLFYRSHRGQLDFSICPQTKATVYWIWVKLDYRLLYLVLFCWAEHELGRRDSVDFVWLLSDIFYILNDHWHKLIAVCFLRGCKCCSRCCSNRLRIEWKNRVRCWLESWAVFWEELILLIIKKEKTSFWTYTSRFCMLSSYFIMSLYIFNNSIGKLIIYKEAFQGPKIILES